MWWRCCQDAVQDQPGWLRQADHEGALDLIRDGEPREGRGSISRAAEAASWVCQALTLTGASADTGQPADTMQEMAARAVGCWAGSPAIFRPENGAEFRADAALAKVAPGYRDSVCELLACLDTPGERDGKAMAAITALLLAGAGSGARRAGVQAVLAHRRQSAPGKPALVRGVTGWLELRELPAGPVGLFPDPVAMRITHGNDAFRASLGLAWQYAADGKSADRCVLWRLVLGENVADFAVDGGSLGAAFAVALHELLLWPATRSSSLAWPRTFLIGIRRNCAITGVLTSECPADYEQARLHSGDSPWLDAVGNIDTKIQVAQDKRLHLVAPAANRAGHDERFVHWAHTLRQADRYARRPRPVQTLVTACVALALAGIAFGASVSGHSRTVFDRIRQTNTVQQLPATGPGLLTSDAPLGVLVDIASYEKAATPQTSDNLAAAASEPLVDAIPAPQNSVPSISFSPDGNSLASGIDSGVVVQNLATGKATFPGWAMQLGAGIQSVAYSPSGNLLAGGDFDGQVFFADPATGALKIGYTFDHFGVDSVAFSPDGQFLATSGLDQIDLWDPVTASDTVWQEHGTVDCVAFSPNGQLLAAGDTNGQVTIDSVTTGSTTATIHAGGSVSSIAYSPTGRAVAIGDTDGKVIIRNLATGATTTLIAGGSVTSVAYSRDGQTLAIGDSDGTVFLYDPTTGTAANLGTGSAVSAIAFSPNGNTLATANATQLDIWNPGGVLTPTLDTTSQVSGVAFSPDSRTLAIGDTDGQITLNTLATGTTKSLNDDSPVTSIAFNQAGKLLASSDNTGTILYNLATGAQRPYNYDHSQAVGAIAFSPNGDLAIGDANNFLILNASTGHASGGWSVQGGTVAALAYSPNGMLLAGAVNGVLGVDVQSGPDKNLPATTPTGGITFFNPRNGEPGGDISASLPNLMPFAGSPVNSLAFSPDSQVLAAGQSDGRVVLHDLKTSAATTFNDGSTVNTVAYSPDGHILASGTANGHVVLRNLVTGTQITLDDGSSVTSLAFSQNGRILASGDEVGHVTLYESVLWSSTFASLKNRLCREIGDINLTQAQWAGYFPKSPYQRTCP